jgi:hemolysin activation/secretion protein
MRRAALALGLLLLAQSVRADPELPPIPPPTAADRLAAQPRVRVSELRFSGNARVTDAELARVGAPWTGRMLATADLIELRAALLRHYQELGFASAEVVLPDQRVRGGALELRIAEGVLEEVSVSSGRAASARWAKARLERAAGGVLDVRALAAELERIGAQPWVERVDALLLPTGAPGVTRLDVQLRERPALGAELRVANDRSPAIGSLSRELALSHASATGRGDPLGLRLGQTEGLLEWEGGYGLPLGASDWALELGAQRSRADVVERPFDDLDIESRSTTWSAGLARSLFSGPRQALSAALRLDLRRSQTELAGSDFWPGTDDGEADASVLRLTADYQRRAPDWAFSGRSTLSLGIDALGATSLGRDALGEPLGDGQFAAWLGQVQLVRRFSPTPRGVELLARASLQLTPDPLLAIERMPLGGPDSVRGYRSHELLRDNAALASLELRVPIWQGGEASLALAPFADLGHGWNRHETPDVKTLCSAGLGLRARWRGLELSAYYGHPFRDVPRDRGDLQGRGVHLELRARAF